MFCGRENRSTCPASVYLSRAPTWCRRGAEGGLKLSRTFAGSHSEREVDWKVTGFWNLSERFISPRGSSAGVLKGREEGLRVPGVHEDALVS